MGALFAWWLAAELIGLAGLPLCALVFANLPDRGWALAKPLGLIAFGWLVWFPLAAISALPYSPGWIVGAFLVFAAGNLALLRRVPRIRETLRRMFAHERVYIAASELLFAGAFGLMAWVRSFTPAVVDTEKFMDVAFLSSLWRTPHLPAPDPWLSGAPINYYYFGHFLLATIAKVLGTQPGTAFNIGIALIFALTAVAVFGVAANLAANLAAVARRRVWPTLHRAIPYGLASVLLVLVLGNLNAAQDWWQQALQATGRGQLLANPWQWWLNRDLWLSYNWWNPSRVIPNTINEFPAFSFILSDLHAHVLALPFAALAVGIAFNLVLAKGEGLRAFGRGPLGILALVTSAVAIGGLYAINGWDLPTYLGLAVLALVIQQYLAHDRRINSLLLLDLFAAAALLAAGCFLVYLPFYRGFVSPSQGIGVVPVDQRTPVGYEFAIFGLPLFILGSLVIWRIVRWAGAALESATNDALVNDPAGSSGLETLLLGRARWIGGAFAAAVLGLLLLWTAAAAGNTGFTLFWCLLLILLCAALVLRHLGVFRSPAVPDDVAPTHAAFVAPASRRPVTDDVGASGWTPSPSLDDAPAPVGALPAAPASAHDDTIPYAELWIFCVLGTVAALVAAAEIIYLRDIFSSRMNTVFKLYFQSWLLLGITAGPALALLLPAMRRQLAGLFAPIAAPSSVGALPAAPAPAGMLAFAGLGRAVVRRTPLQLPHRHALAAKSNPQIPAESATSSAAQTEISAESATASESAQADFVAEGHPGAVSTAGSPGNGTKPHSSSVSSVSSASSVVKSLSPFVSLRGLRVLRGLSVPRPSLPLALRWLRAGGILIWTAALAALVCAALVYPVLATSARTANFSLPRSLDGTAYMATDPVAAAAGCNGAPGAGTNHGDDQAIAWLNTHVQGSPVIVEAPGCEWTHYSRISAFTGLPTLIGWPGGHEGEWRTNWFNTVSPNDPYGGNYIGQRMDAVNRIYTDPNSSQVIALLKQYDARLVYVGAAERQLYANADLSRFGTFLRVIYAHDDVTIYEVPW